MRKKKAVFCAGTWPITIVLAALFPVLILSCGILGGKEEQDERIVYYYRYCKDPGPDKLTPLLESMVREERVADSRGRAALVHFFATAFQENPESVQKLEDLEQKYPGEPGGFIKAIIGAARNYSPAALKSPADLKVLWSEYWATGDRTIVRRMIEAAIGNTPLEGKDSRDEVKRFLMKKATHHWEVYQAIRTLADDAPNDSKRDLIGEIATAVKTSAYDPARDRSHRGRNYYIQKQYAKAMTEFEKGLAYFPDYPAIYVNIANIHSDRKNFAEAIKAGRRAADIQPDEPSRLTNLAIYYARSGQDDEAIRWYLKALEYDPEGIDAIGGLGSCHARMHDTEKAVFYYRKYLESEPEGHQSAFARKYLASVGREFREDPADVVVMLKNGRYTDLEKTLGALLREKKRDKQGEGLLFRAYEKLCDAKKANPRYERRISEFKAWLAQVPSSHFANAALGMIHIEWAWHARGGGFASTITAEGHRLFRERLLAARQYLETAYSSDRSDPNVPARLITTAMGLGSDSGEVEKQLKRAVEADPSDHRAFFAKLTCLMPKWGGSREEMFSFAREAAGKAPPNSKIAMVLANAHWEMYRQSDNDPLYYREPEVWKEVKGAHETALKSFPEASNIRNWLARIAYLAGDHETAGREFARIGDDWYAEAWPGKRAFEETKSKVMTNRTGKAMGTKDR